MLKGLGGGGPGDVLRAFRIKERARIDLEIVKRAHEESYLRAPGTGEVACIKVRLTTRRVNKH